MQRTDAGLALVGAQRRMVIWLAIYAIALVAFALFVIGDVPFAVFLIVVTEVIFLTLRPQPKFDASTYRPPAPARWQPPITVLRWAALISNGWAIATAALFLTIATLVVLVVLIVIGWHYGFGVANFAVLALYVAWLSTRPLWIAPLRRALRVGAAKQLAPYMATLHVGTDGVEVDMRPAFIVRAPESYRFSVGYAELDEVRMMDGLTAQGYMGSMAQYDPTFTIRMEWELFHFIADQRARPSILPMFGFGTTLLLRSSTLFYMLGNADQFGPAAVAAWQAWRAAQPAPAAPTA